ncbi:MAG TPA: response regulator [Pyrinomonadaceae bacterium]|nr:response regulator [Pyrinomonadaceae bacterium]
MSGSDIAPRVLVVDDQSDNLTLISMALQEKGYRVSTAVNGEDAVSVALLVLPQLILMDISMPKLDGIGATRVIRGEGKIKDVPIVILTALDDDQFRREANEAGADGYFTKPIDFPRLNAFMDKLLRGTSGEEQEAKRSAISPDTGRLDPRFVLWRMFCAANDVPVETLPSDLSAELKKRWQLLKNEKRPLFRL